MSSSRSSLPAQVLGHKTLKSVGPTRRGQVSVAGLTLGGGIGKLTRLYGLTCDSLRSVELISADGQLMRADGTENPDLFWASRGGGGGNFGVVTALEFDLKPADFPCSRIDWEWPWHARHRAFVAFQSWMNSAPRSSTGTFTFSTSPPGSQTPQISADAVFFGPTQTAASFFAAFESEVGIAPTKRETAVVDYLQLEKDVFCANISIEECRLRSQSPIGKVDRYGTSVKSAFVNGSWPAAAVDLISEQLERRQRDQTMTRDPADSNKGKIWFEVMGGAVGDIAAKATAFAHRDATLIAQFQARWNTEATDDVRVANIEWLREAYAALAPFHSSGAYVNYTDSDLEQWGQEYYSENLRRLKRVKVQYDPHNFFGFPQSISST